MHPYEPWKKTCRLTASGAEKRDNLDLVAELTEGWNELLLVLINGDDFFASAAGLFLLLFWKIHTGLKFEVHSLNFEIFLYILLLGVMTAKGSDNFYPYFLTSLHFTILRPSYQLCYSLFCMSLFLLCPCPCSCMSPLRVFTCGTYWGQVTNSVTPFSVCPCSCYVPVPVCPPYESSLAAHIEDKLPTLWLPLLLYSPWVSVRSSPCLL